MDYDIGSIVMLENVVFKTTYLNNKLTKKFIFDHAKKDQQSLLRKIKKTHIS